MMGVVMKRVFCHSQCHCPDWRIKSTHGCFDWVTWFFTEFWFHQNTLVAFEWMTLFCTWASFYATMLGHIWSFCFAGGPLSPDVNDTHNNDPAKKSNFSLSKYKTVVSCIKSDKSATWHLLQAKWWHQSPFSSSRFGVINASQILSSLLKQGITV